MSKAVVIDVLETFTGNKGFSDEEMVQRYFATASNRNAKPHIIDDSTYNAYYRPPLGAFARDLF